MFRTLARSPVISQMPSIPEPASATAIGTPPSRNTSSTSIGNATTMKIFRKRPASRGGGRLLGQEQRLTLAHARQVGEHQNGEREESDRHQTVGRPDQDRQGAELGVFVQPAKSLNGC